MNQLGHRKLHRPAAKTGEAICAERVFADFLVDGQSLLEILVEKAGGHSDFMSALVAGYPEESRRVSSKLLGTITGTRERVLIYICPECGDVGCGAYSVLVRRERDLYIWENFAYQTSDTGCEIVEMLGVFFFEAKQYEAALAAAVESVDGR